MMKAGFLLLGGLAVVACKQGSSTDGNASASTNAAVERAVDQCAPPTLALPDSAQLASALLDETRSNFTAAYQGACDKGYLKGKALIDPKASDQATLFLINAPEANVASIYLSEVDGNRMVLEYPFLTTDGKTHVPTADELAEAIYCKVEGATPEEQESTGRCLVD